MGCELTVGHTGRIAATVYRFARELEARGAGKGDRVMLWDTNCPDWIAAFFGCCLRGSIIVPLDASITPDFVRRVQQQVEAKLMLCDRKLSHLLPPFSEQSVTLPPD